mgnify:FL=1
MNGLVAEKKIMSNVSGKLYDEQRIVDSLYIEPELKEFASLYGKRNELSLTFILSRIIEFCVTNKSKISVNKKELVDGVTRKGVKTTVRVKKDVYSKFTDYVEGEIETNRSAYLNMILRKMYQEKSYETEFNTGYLEKLLIA